VRITAVRQLAVEAADNGPLASELASGITRVKGVESKGVRLGNWLTVKQAQTLLSTPDANTTKGLRDRAILAVLIGCGLRRSEAAAITFGHVQQRDGRWCIVDLVGKHGRVRTIPMPAWVKVAIDAWTAGAGISAGPVFRPVNRQRQVWGESRPMTWGGLREDVPSGGGELEQIQLLLGHASVQTTERYLGTRQDLVHAPNDGIRLRVAVWNSVRYFAKSKGSSAAGEFYETIDNRSQYCLAGFKKASGILHTLK
jgi:integrase